VPADGDFRQFFLRQELGKQGVEDVFLMLQVHLIGVVFSSMDLFPELREMRDERRHQESVLFVREGKCHRRFLSYQRAFNTCAKLLRRIVLAPCREMRAMSGVLEDFAFLDARRARGAFSDPTSGASGILRNEK
jgi:hypothetical protein